MILARNALEQVDIDVAEDGKTLVATGHTSDPDDTAHISEPLDPTMSFEDQASALRFKLELANAVSRGLRELGVELGLNREGAA